MLGHPQQPTCNTQKGRTLANHTPRKRGSGRDSLCRITWDTRHKAKKHVQRTGNQSLTLNLKPLRSLESEHKTKSQLCAVI